MPAIEPKFRDPIYAGVAAATGIAIPGLFVPALDMAGVGVAWTAMVAGIADKAGLDLTPAAAAKLVAAGVAAVSGYIFGSKLLTWAATPLILAFPVAGVPAAIAVNATLNGLFTLRLGMTCASKFSRPDFDASDVLELAMSISTFLVKIPTREELALVREIVAAW
ncbi:hypothetical protein [Streptomyces shaanxiensis]|uniref:DUF697 domain-containing protein n=1 Tax=Streptomyces shaanxiensis TaxID=653357 RepID=A0ABP7WK36_9ACTN